MDRKETGKKKLNLPGIIISQKSRAGSIITPVSESAIFLPPSPFFLGWLLFRWGHHTFQSGKDFFIEIWVQSPDLISPPPPRSSENKTVSKRPPFFTLAAAQSRFITMIRLERAPHAFRIKFRRPAMCTKADAGWIIYSFLGVCSRDP